MHRHDDQRAEDRQKDARSNFDDDAINPERNRLIQRVLLHKVALLDPVSRNVVRPVGGRIVELLQVFDLIQEVVWDTHNDRDDDNDEDGQLGSSETAPLIGHHVVTHKDVPVTMETNSD